jgi:hypothetical protein
MLILNNLSLFSIKTCYEFNYSQKKYGGKITTKITVIPINVFINLGFKSRSFLTVIFFEVMQRLIKQTTYKKHKILMESNGSGDILQYYSI